MVRSKGTSKVRSCARRVGAAVTAVAAAAGGMVFAAAPATAVAAGSDFSLVYGASYYKGTATFFNRTVDVKGSFKATGCRRVYAKAFAGSTPLDFKSTSTWCNTSGPANFSLDANVAGGSDNIWVYMTDENQKILKAQTCYRSGSCVDGLH